jgi:RimJ/RimL family protein N-acetyltransferase
VIIRKAKSTDVALFYTWANDPEVRKNSFSSGSIEFEEHQKWFSSKINSDKCLMLILENDEKPVGQIRISIEEDIGIINFSVDKNFRGKGIGTELLKKGLEFIRKENISLTYLKALVKKDNRPSQKAFEKAGYLLLDGTNDPLEYRLTL